MTDVLFRAHLRPKIEPCDHIIRSMAAQERGHTSRRDLLYSLREQDGQFWQQLDVDTLLHLWLQSIGQNLRLPAPPTPTRDLKTSIWNQFLRRLSLDLWILTDDVVRGNKMVNLFLDTIQDTLYQQFPLPVLNVSSALNAPVPPPIPPTRRPPYVPQLDIIREDDKEKDASDKADALSTASARLQRTFDLFDLDSFPAPEPTVPSDPKMSELSGSGMRVVTPTTFSNGRGGTVIRLKKSSKSKRRAKKESSSDSENDD